MGIYKSLAKIEELLESQTSIKRFAWTSGWVSIEVLPDKYRDALIQFGYNKNAPLFGTHCESPNDSSSTKKYDLIYIDYAKGGKDWCDLLYGDVDRNWRHVVTFKNESTEEAVNSNIQEVERCYETLQKLFTFLDIYCKHREELVKLVKIEYDNI